MKNAFSEMYAILGLDEGASPEDVKKSYFRLVRQYTPEQHPEEFQKIRLAYETLKDRNPEEEEKSGCRPYEDENALLNAVLGVASDMVEEGRYRDAAEILEQVRNYTEDSPDLLKMLAFVYIQNGNSQKAGKIAELGTRMDPSDRHFWIMMANGYAHRGWYKKALPAFGKAYELGFRDTEFLVGYAENLIKAEREEETAAILWEALENAGEKETEEYLLFRAFLYLARVAPGEGWGVSRYLDAFDSYIRKNKRMLRDQELAGLPMRALLLRGPDFFHSVSDWKRAEKSMDQLLKSGVIDPEEAGSSKSLFRLFCVSEDERILSEFWRGLVISLTEKDDERRARYAELDGKLCLLKQREEARANLPVIRKDYPWLAEAYANFLDLLENGSDEDIRKLYEGLKWQYDKIASLFEMGQFKKLYPDEYEDRESTEYELKATNEKPYVRTGKKVGRNDPCPCGSGKKFKKCCMGKGIYEEA